MGGIVKEPKKKYKMGLGKKIVAALCAVLIVVGVGLGVYFGLANKDNNNIIDQPGIEQPENPENPGGDIEQPEDPENPGGDIEQPEDPENPGGDIEEPEDPENPGGDIEQPEDPENPGGDIEDPKDPFVLDTLDELMAYRQGTLYNTLNEKFMNKTISKFTFLNNYTYEDTTNVKWAILESSQTDISKVQVRFNMLRNGSYYYYAGEITFSEPISVQDFANGNITQSMIDKASYLRTYSANVIADQMEQNQPLAEAIVTELGGTVGANDQLLLAMDNASTDPQLHEVRIVYVKQVTETGVNEYKVTIAAKNGSGDIDHLISNLEAGQYKNGTVEKNVIELAPAFDENSVDKQTPEYEETAKTASRVSIGRMTNEKGDVYDLYLDL